MKNYTRNLMITFLLFKFAINKEHNGCNSIRQRKEGFKYR